MSFASNIVSLIWKVFKYPESLLPVTGELIVVLSGSWLLIHTGVYEAACGEDFEKHYLDTEKFI